MELARQDLADLIGARPRDVILTGSGTESIDLAVRGILGAASPRGGLPVVVSTRIEHAAVRDLLEDLAKAGTIEVRWAPVTREGVLDVAGLEGLLDTRVALVTIQWANNETGAIQPVDAIGSLCRARKVPFHCDGTQWVGKAPVTVLSAPFDLLTFSPHKFHGPKGVGGLWIRGGVRLRPVVHGAQELGRRGGTENVPGILGAGAAAREAADWLASPAERTRLAALRDGFERGVLAGVNGGGEPIASVNGPTGPGARLWNTTNIGFARLEAEALLMLLSEQGLCASAGAACSSGSLDPSPVLLAMGIPPETAHGSVRFSLSRESSEAEVREAVGVVVAAVKRLAGSSSALTP